MSKPEFLSLVPAKSPHKVIGERVVLLPGMALEILTTRRIELEHWELEGLNDPYWRLYVPTLGEAAVWTATGGNRIETRMVPGRAYLIAPRTTISSSNPVPFGKWYVHFTLGPGADRAKRGVYAIELTSAMSAALDGLAQSGAGQFPWTSASLVSEALRQLPDEVWRQRRVDARIERAMDFMHTNLNRKLSIADVATFAGLSVRNLNHLFREQIHITPMSALLDFRLDKACRLLRHTGDSIEQVAAECGFPNRHYFSRMLKRHRGASPAAYRQGQV